jgi:predicted SAM-dependent methyltransferase
MRCILFMNADSEHISKNRRSPKTQKLLNILVKMRRLIFRSVFAIRHRWIIRNYLRSHQIRKLQIGCGQNVIRVCLNTDLNPTIKIVFVYETKRLPFDDCTFDYIFCEHLIEHLKYLDGERLILECYRILKPGGKVRISTPDLRFLLELYSENKTDLQKRYITWAVNSFLPEIGIYSEVFVINNFFRAWGHKFIYDYNTLCSLLNKSGFFNIKRYAPKDSDDKNLQGIECHGTHMTDEFNCLESIVLEGKKQF